MLLLLLGACITESDQVYRSTNADGRLIYYQKASVNELDMKNHAINEVLVSDTLSAFIYQATHISVESNLVESNLQELSSKKLIINHLDTSPISMANIEDWNFAPTDPWILKLHFDNDIFNNTDYYYTNGAQISLVTPMANQSPLNLIFPKSRNNHLDLKGFSITQNIYTPTNPDVSEVMTGDRPFSSYLTIGQFRESYDLTRRISFKSSLDMGVMGPAAMGDYVQSSIHEINPVGWRNQIQNDFVLNYHLQVEKGLISNPAFELNVMAKMDVGTLYNRASAGLDMRLGSFTPVYRGTVWNNGPFQYWFSLKGELSGVAYDATLQGGLFNEKNPYTIPAHDINRLVVKASIGFAAYYKNYGLEFENFYWSPEFNGAYDFRYGRLSIIAKF